MKILMMTENDPAGVAISFCRAINAFSEHSCRLITTSSRYGFSYERDIHLPDTDADGIEEIGDLLAASDIFCFHILFDETRKIGPFSIKDYCRGRQIIHHHHGHPDFRGNPARYREKYRNTDRIILVSTPDLLELVPRASWVPNPVPVDDPLFMPAPFTRDDRIMLCQAPTRKELKNTAEFIDVAGEICRENSDVGYRIIENTRYSECLLLKRESHIHFDHMQGYYGVSSLESLSQGRPVIAGLSRLTIEHINRFTGNAEIPWMIARNRHELKERILDLVHDRALRVSAGEKGREFMTKHWHERQIAERFFEACGIKTESLCSVN